MHVTRRVGELCGTAWTVVVCVRGSAAVVTVASSKAIVATTTIVATCSGLSSRNRLATRTRCTSSRPARRLLIRP
uniref:Putative secreted protein n=1 Tax=Anopheles darlingi TaxID=43151 RepID=A0A2M4DQ24_ANODA